jgi:pimeloyl-ACP methyl ester carboxylesterase
MIMRLATLALLALLTASSCTSTTPAKPRVLYAEGIGSGERAVVVLPGLLGSTRYWQGAGFEQLATTHTILYVDPLGFGRSPKPKTGYALDDHLTALHEVMQRNGVTSRVTIVGHSFGALLAMQYAAAYPEEVDQLFLLGTPLFGDDAEALRLEASGGFAGEYVRHPRWLRFVCGAHDLTRGVLRPFVRLNRTVPKAVAEDALLHTWHSLDGTIRGVILPTRAEAVLARVRARVTFVHGRSDIVTPLARVHDVAHRFGARVVETDNDHRHYTGPATMLIVRELKGELP